MLPGHDIGSVVSQQWNLPSHSGDGFDHSRQCDFKAGATQAFTATLTNTTNMTVTWKVNGTIGGDASVGTITAAGMYTAPSSVSASLTATVTAVSAADASRTDRRK